MTTSIDSRPITSFEDLVAAVGASPETRRKKATLMEALLNVLFLMPLLMVVFAVVWLLCAAYWWGRYWDEVMMGILGLLQIAGL